MPNSICNIAVDAEAEIAYVSEHNALNALHLSNGQELWRQSFPSINRIERILPDDKLLVSLERRSDFNPVFGLFDTKTREFIWAHQDEKFGDTCYLVEDVLAVRYDTQVHAYSVNSGERLWRFKFSSDFTIGSEALDGNLLAIWGKDRLIVIDASAGKIAWTAELPSQPDVVAINEDAIAVLSKKTIASFDRLDGRLLSVQPVDKAEMVFRAGPMILVRSRGLLHAMKAGKFL